MINTAQLTPEQRNRLAQQLLQARRVLPSVVTPAPALTLPVLPVAR